MEITLTITSNNPTEMAGFLQGLGNSTTVITREIPAVDPAKNGKAGKKENPAETNNGTPAGNSGASEDNNGAISVEKVREVVTAKTQAGHRAKVVELLKKYDAANVSVLDKKNFQAFLNDVNAL